MSSLIPAVLCYNPLDVLRDGGLEFIYFGSASKFNGFPFVCIFMAANVISKKF